jgi:hypothetical protein
MPRRTSTVLWVAVGLAAAAAAGMRSVPANAPARVGLVEAVPPRRNAPVTAAPSSPFAASAVAIAAAAAGSAAAEAMVPRPSSVSTTGTAADEGPPAARSRALGGSKGSAFGVMNWKPPPPPPPVVVAAPPAPVAPPPPPTAPPLPFTFVGMAERGADKPQAYLAKGNSLLVVSVGDLIDGGQYRVDALGPTGVNLTYLPLNKPQMLSIP